MTENFYWNIIGAKIINNVNFVHAAHVIFVLIFVLRPHPLGTQEKYNTGIFI